MTIQFDGKKLERAIEDATVQPVSTQRVLGHALADQRAPANRLQWIEGDIWKTDDLSLFLESIQTQHTRPGVHSGASLSEYEFSKMTQLVGPVLDHGAFPGVRRIEVKPEVSTSKALSYARHEPHMDGTFTARPPSVFLLGFAHVDGHGGGVSQLWSTFDMFAEMPTTHVHTFASSEAVMSRVRNDGKADEYRGPLWCYGSDGNPFLRWRYDEFVQPQLVTGDRAKWDRAVNWVREYLNYVKPITYAAKEGDTLVVPNRRFLHGRTALHSESDRLVFRVWNR